MKLGIAWLRLLGKGSSALKNRVESKYELQETGEEISVVAYSWPNGYRLAFAQRSGPWYLLHVML